MIKFDGFTPDVFSFFADLEMNNDRPWFQRNKQRYASSVRDPLLALLDELESEFGSAKVFRIQRDTRFSADKSPYKVNQGAIIDRGARGSLYVSIDANAVAIGMGMPGFDRDQLERYRAAVAGDAGADLDAVVRSLRRWGATVGTISGTATVEGTDLKRVPKPYAPDHPRAWYLKLKALVAVREWEQPDWLFSRSAVKQLRDTWRHFGALEAWLETNVGPPNPALNRRFG